MIFFALYIVCGFLTPFFAHLFYDKSGERFYFKGEEQFKDSDLIFFCVIWPIIWFIFIVTFLYTFMGDLGSILRRTFMDMD